MDAEEREIKIGDALYNFEADALTEAKKRGCILITPKENELLVDIDSKEDYTEFLLRMNDINCNNFNLELKITKNTPSQSGLPHRHIYVDVFNADTQLPVVLTEWQRIALQFLLGSDRVREILSTYRLMSDVKIPTRFFEPK